MLGELRLVVAMEATTWTRKRESGGLLENPGYQSDNHYSALIAAHLPFKTKRATATRSAQIDGSVVLIHTEL